MGKTSRPSDRSLESSDPEWDTTPLRMRAWWELLAEWLPLEEQDPDLPLWWSQGAVLDRNGTVSGPTYLRTCALRDNSVREHTLEEPITIDIFVDAPTPRGVSALSSDDLKNFKPNIFLSRKKERYLAKLITSTITVRKARRDWLKRCNYSGLLLLPMLKDKLDEIGPIANDAAAAHIAELMAAGPGEISMAAFNSWRDECDMWNATQSGDAVIQDLILIALAQPTAISAAGSWMHLRDASYGGRS